MARTYTVVFLREEDGRYSVVVPALRGCTTWGATLPEAIRMAEDALQAYLKSLSAHGDPIPDDVSSFTLDLEEAQEALVYRLTVREAAPVA